MIFHTFDQIFHEIRFLSAKRNSSSNIKSRTIQKQWFYFENGRGRNIKKSQYLNLCGLSITLKPCKGKKKLQVLSHASQIKQIWVEKEEVD